MKKISRRIFFGLVIGIAIGVVMAFLASSVQAALPASGQYFEIAYLDVDYDEGSFQWQAVSETTVSGNLTVSIDSETVLQKVIESDIHVLCGRIINPREYEAFNLNETAGIHVINVSIESNNVTVTEVLVYEYGDHDITIEELEAEEETEEAEDEDWLECP